MGILKQTKYCCNEHINIGIDDFLMENETFPYLDYTNENNSESNKIKCDYCNKIARYALKTKL